eukprot:TRINITY_DN422_c2_g1_i3.p1 TRINITY_DN422_c2_g1~~TRINITY_DN422_c2_g1_i3.p1  ORF type:complete len:312 (+),score=58.76 TRINITY_DN422_c2_g1_i3:556-1491(+)
MTGASSTEPVSSLAHRMTSEFENLDKKRQVEGSRASNTEGSVIDLCSEVFGEQCHSAESALVILRDGIQKLQKEKDASSERVNESESRLKIIEELIAVAKSIRSSGTIVPEDAVFIIQEELVNAKNEIRDFKARIADSGPAPDPSLNIQEVSKQLSLDLLSAHNRFNIDKAVITSYSEKKGKAAVLYTIEVTSSVGKRWTVQIRFKKFDEMRKRLGESAKGIPFPSATFNKSRKRRMEQLNTFLAAMVERSKRGDNKIAAEISTFLTSDEQEEDGFESDGSYDSLNGSVSYRSYSPKAAPTSPRNDSSARD